MLVLLRVTVKFAQLDSIAQILRISILHHAQRDLTQLKEPPSVQYVLLEPIVQMKEHQTQTFKI